MRIGSQVLLLLLVLAGKAWGGADPLMASKSTSSIAHARYSIADLGIPEGMVASVAVAINDSGQVVLMGYDKKTYEPRIDEPSIKVYRPYLYSPDKSLTAFQDLLPAESEWKSDVFLGVSLNTFDRLPASYGRSTGGAPINDLALASAMFVPPTFSASLNNDGQVIGEGATGGTRHAFILTPGKAVEGLGTLCGRERHGRSSGRGINDRGQVTGTSDAGSSCGASGIEQRAFSFSRETGLTDLGTLGGRRSAGLSINNAGQIAGWSEFGPGRATHAFVYTPGVGMKDLGTLGGAASRGRHINELGQVTGWASTRKGTKHAFLYTAGRPMQDLGALSQGLAFSEGVGINDAGQVVGNAYVDSSGGGQLLHAFLYSEESGMLDLNTLVLPGTGWELTEATAINNRGQITAGGRHVGMSGVHAVVLTPVVH